MSMVYILILVFNMGASNVQVGPYMGLEECQTAGKFALEHMKTAQNNDYICVPSGRQ